MHQTALLYNFRYYW